MKASELIEKLQEEIKHHGDRELKGSCDHLCEEGDGTFDIGEIGWLSGRDGENYIMLICAECAYMSRLDHIRGKYEFDVPDNAYYPDEYNQPYEEEWP